MRVQGIDHVEFYVADADEAAGLLRTAYGFRLHGPAGPHALRRGQHSVLARHGGIQVVLTAGTAPDDPVTEYVRCHGDGLATIALATAEPEAALAEAVARGAVPLPGAPTEPVPTVGRVRVTAFGDVAHTFVAPGELAARFAATPSRPAEPGPGAAGPLDLFDTIDHVAVCVPAGALGPTIRFYQDVLGFAQIFEEYIEVGEQAMNSQVVQSPSGDVTLTVLEPDAHRLPGQIDDFLAAHAGPGVQHLAFRTGDIAGTVRTLAGRGVHFLRTPVAYYDELARRLPSVGVPLETLRELSVLVDRDEVGELFQIFTQSTHPRRTFFVEVIERRAARTFGSANIKALYEAVERERTGATIAAGVTG